MRLRPLFLTLFSPVQNFSPTRFVNYRHLSTPFLNAKSSIRISLSSFFFSFFFFPPPCASRLISLLSLVISISQCVFSFFFFSFLSLTNELFDIFFSQQFILGVSNDCTQCYCNIIPATGPSYLGIY